MRVSLRLANPVGTRVSRATPTEDGCETERLTRACPQRAHFYVLPFLQLSRPEAKQSQPKRCGDALSVRGCLCVEVCLVREQVCERSPGAGTNLELDSRMRISPSPYVPPPPSNP